VGHGHGHYLFFFLQLLAACSQLGSAFHYSAVVAMTHTGILRFFDFVNNHGSTYILGKKESKNHWSWVFG
jgi:hypothetical protein